jgi:hypothetical protein
MKLRLITTTIFSTITALIVSSPAQSQTKPNQIGPSLSFGGGESVFGVDARFPVSQNISIRPNVRFPGGGVALGAAATYDFNSNWTVAGLEPYVGAGLNLYTGDNSNNGANLVGYAIGGADYALSNQFNLTGSLNIPFTSGYSTNISLGIGYKY